MVIYSRINSNSLFFVLPVNKPEPLEFTTIVADRDYVEFELTSKQLVCSASCPVKDELEEEKDLFVALSIEIESKLLETLLLGFRL